MREFISKKLSDMREDISEKLSDIIRKVLNKVPYKYPKYQEYIVVYSSLITAEIIIYIIWKF